MSEPIAVANTPEWKELRRTGLGASDSAVAVGLSPWRTPIELWGEKVFGFEQEQTRAMLMGKLLEPVVATLFQIETGLQFRPQPGMYRHSEIDWLLATPDALIADGRLAEFKTTTSRNDGYGEEGTDQVPMDVLCQVHQQMAVTGAPAVVIAVLVLDTRELKQYVVERHTKFVDGLIAKESKFWDCVTLRVPPPVDLRADGAAAAIRRTFRTVDEGKAIDLDDGAEFEADCLARWKATIKDAESKRDELQAKLMLRMQDAELGRLPNGSTVVRKAVECTVKEHVRKYVTLTVKESK